MRHLARGAAGGLLALMASGCADRAVERMRAGYECEVLIAVTREALADNRNWGGKPMIFVIADPHSSIGQEAEAAAMTDPRTQKGWSTERGPAAPPPNALVRSIYRQTSDGYRPCDAWFELLRRHGASFGRAAADADVAHVDQSGEFRASIVSFSRPAVDQYGTQAVVAQSQASGLSQGLGRLVELGRRPRGRWTTTGRLTLWAP